MESRQHQQQQKKVRSAPAAAAAGGGASAGSSPMKKNKGKVNLLDRFNALGAYRWLNLETMDKHKPYHIINLRKSSTKFGERVVAEFQDGVKLTLPERYTSFTDRQLSELGCGDYCLVNQGKEGKMFKLQLVKRDQVGGKTMESPSSPQPPLPPPPPPPPAHQQFDEDGAEEEDEDGEYPVSPTNTQLDYYSQIMY